MLLKFLQKKAHFSFLKLHAFALFALTSVTAVAQDVTAGTNFNLCGRAATGIYSTRPTNANFNTGTGEIVTDIVATTNTGDAIDFDNDGFAEVVLRTIGNNSTSANQTRVYIFEASANNNYERVAIQLVDNGANNASVGLSKGLDVGNIDGDADVEIVLSSGASTSTFLTAYDVSSIFAVTELAQSRMYGFTGSLISTSSGTINTVKIVPNKNGNTNADVIISQATGTITHLAAVEFDNTSAFTWLTSGAMSNYNGGVYAFNVADIDADGDLEIIMLCETATSSLRIREYSTNATAANRFGTADLTVTGNWNATSSGGQAYTNIAIADIDNDGDLEAVCPDFQNKTIKVVTFDGANYVATTAVDLVAANSIPIAVAVGDLDNDGFQELYYSRVNSANVTLREHNGVANTFATSNFPNFLTVLSGLGTDNEATALALNTLNNSADKDNNFDLFVGRGNNITDTDLDGDEFFVVEINRLFGGGFGVGGVGATPTVISGGFYDNITADGTVGLSGTVQVNGILRIRNGSLNTGATNLNFGSLASGIIDSTGNLNISGGTTDFANRPVSILSNKTTTGRIDQIVGSLINASNVTVERYIPEGRRTTRFLGHPFSNALDMSSLIDDVFVTGGNYLTGFDSTGTQSPSAFWFSNPSTWTAFTSTSDASWTQYRGIRVLVRGDRTQANSLTGVAYTPNAVTLDMTGTLNTGNQNIVLPTGYSVVSNPYPSPVNVGARLNATTNIGTQFWFWDANAGPTAGAYRTKVMGSAATIPMNGAFVVEPTAPTTINFEEADKVATDSSNLFRTSNTASGLLELQVLYNNYPSDNLYVRFNNSANDNKDGLDGVKLTNPEVNFYAVSADNQKLSLDTRVFSNNKIIPLGFTSTAANSFTIKAADLGIAEEVYLKDKLLNVETKLDATTTYTFSVDPANANTVGENRFELVFRTSAALPTTFVSVAAQQKGAAIEVSYNTANETNMHSYEVEESKDGSSFTKGTTLEAKNATANNYNWLDANIHNGNNYYRVKAIEKNGAVKYSQVVRVNVGTKRSEFTVYPNPVKGGTINLQLTDIEKGVYTVKVVNNLGQEIAAKQIIHNGGSANQTISIGNAPTGKYNMIITNGATTVTKTVIVE